MCKRNSACGSECSSRQAPNARLEHEIGVRVAERRVAIDRRYRPNAAMKMVGHKTEAIYRRCAIVDEAMMKERGGEAGGVAQAICAGRTHPATSCARPAARTCPRTRSPSVTDRRARSDGTHRLRNPAVSCLRSGPQAVFFTRGGILARDTSMELPDITTSSTVPQSCGGTKMIRRRW